MNGLDDWKDLGGNFGARLTIYQKVLHAIRNSGANVFVEGVDVNRLNARYKFPDNPHEVTLRHTLERVNERCAREGKMCKVVADTVPRQSDFNDAIRAFTHVATPGYRGVQADEMCAYILRRHREEMFANKIRS